MRPMSQAPYFMAAYPKLAILLSSISFIFPPPQVDLPLVCRAGVSFIPTTGIREGGEAKNRVRKRKEGKKWLKSTTGDGSRNGISIDGSWINSAWRWRENWA